MKALREVGAEDNTIIFFLSDNGGCAEQNIKGEKAVPPGPGDSFTSYRRPWANASNTPFRLYKHWVHEGGISTPFIASWPAVIKNHNSLHHERAHIIDLMATALDVAGGKYPSTYQGRQIHPLEGKSLLPAFQGRRRELHEAIYWEHEGNKAVSTGKWKLVSRYPDKWQLFDLEEDRTELRDLSGDRPGVVKDLAARWQAWADRSNVVPWADLRRHA